MSAWYNKTSLITAIMYYLNLNLFKTFTQFHPHSQTLTHFQLRFSWIWAVLWENSWIWASLVALNFWCFWASFAILGFFVWQFWTCGATRSIFYANIFGFWRVCRQLWEVWCIFVCFVAYKQFGAFWACWQTLALSGNYENFFAVFFLHVFAILCGLVI